MSGFKWDETKAAANLLKHGVSFDEADTVVFGVLSTWAADLRHFDAEARVQVTGWSSAGRLLVVIVSTAGSRPRIISARRATKRERHEYEARP